MLLLLLLLIVAAASLQDIWVDGVEDVPRGSHAKMQFTSYLHRLLRLWHLDLQQQDTVTVSLSVMVRACSHPQLTLH